MKKFNNYVKISMIVISVVLFVTYLALRKPPKYEQPIYRAGGLMWEK